MIRMLLDERIELRQRRFGPAAFEAGAGAHPARFLVRRVEREGSRVVGIRRFECMMETVHVGAAHEHRHVARIGCELDGQALDDDVKLSVGDCVAGRAGDHRDQQHAGGPAACSAGEESHPGGHQGIRLCRYVSICGPVRVALTARALAVSCALRSPNS